MADLPEAACLLQTGAQYPRRLGLVPAAGDMVFAGFKRGAFSLYFGDAPFYHFDLEGRWQRAFLSGIHYLKALDGGIAAIDRVREGANLVLKRRPLSFAEATDLDATVRDTALDLLDRMNTGALGPIDPPAGVRPIAPDELREFLERIAGWDASAWFSHRERYLGTYGPLPFLPPDGQNAVLLQATLGHADGLAFGGGPPAEHYIRTPAEFAEHARTVAKLLGRRVEQCRGLFLGGADVLRRPIDDVAAYLATIAEEFPADGGIAAFLDRFEPPLPDAEGWRRLRTLNLRRVHLGIESGSPAVRTAFGKTWSDEALRATVADLKAAGVEVGLIVLAGPDQDDATTADLLNALELGAGDLVTLIDAGEFAGKKSQAGGSPAALRERLAPLRGRKAKVVPYSLEKQGIGGP